MKYSLIVASILGASLFVSSAVNAQNPYPLDGLYYSQGPGKGVLVEDRLGEGLRNALQGTIKDENLPAYTKSVTENSGTVTVIQQNASGTEETDTFSTGTGGTVSTQGPVSGDGSSSDPVTIADGAIDSDAIADAGIANVDLANNSVDGSNLRPNSVGSSEIEANAVGTSELAANSVRESEILDGSVTSAKMNSGVAADGFVATADGTGGVAFEGATGGAVSTSSPVSGDGTTGSPVTIANQAITRDSLSSGIIDTLDRADNVPFALTYRINESAAVADGQSTYWIGNIYEAHLDMTVHTFEVETLIPSGQDRTYRGTLVPLTRASATSYTADANPVQVVIREPGRTFGTQAVITGNGTQRTLEIQAPGREFHVNEGGYFFLGVGISNAIDETYVIGASGATEEDHADHTGFSFDVMTYVSKGSNDEGSRTQLAGTEFFASAASAIRMDVHYDAAPGGLQDGVATSVVCTGNDLVLDRSQGLTPLTASGACQSGRWLYGHDFRARQRRRLGRQSSDHRGRSD